MFFLLLLRFYIVYSCHVSSAVVCHIAVSMDTCQCKNCCVGAQLCAKQTESESETEVTEACAGVMQVRRAWAAAWASVVWSASQAPRASRVVQARRGREDDRAMRVTAARWVLLATRGLLDHRDRKASPAVSARSAIPACRGPPASQVSWM